MLPSSSGLWTPVGGCGCFHRVQRWLGTCPVLGDKWVLWHQGRRKWLCSRPSPHSSQLVLPHAGMFALVVTVLTLPLDVSAGNQDVPAFPCRLHPPGCRQGGSRMQTGAQGGGAEQGIKFWGGNFLSRAVFMDLWGREGTLMLEEGAGQSWASSWWTPGSW